MKLNKKEFADNSNQFWLNESPASGGALSFSGDALAYK